MIGQGIAPDGERKEKERLYQKQIASTVSVLLGENFHADDHPVANPVVLSGKTTIAEKELIKNKTTTDK